VSEEGLGRLPRHLPSVSSLLLFNTQENPYKKYVSLDNLAGKEPEKKKEAPKKELYEAPKTFIEGDTLPAVAVIEYNYRPVLGDVPELHLPSVLPNLPNVADLNWSVTSSSSIAPSSDKLPVELPVVEAIPPPAVSVAHIDTSILPTTFSEPAPSGGGPPPPPPPPSAPPPPPPPSAPSVPPPPPSESVMPDSSDSGRAGLLADIRKGRQLKSAKNRKISTKAPSSKKEKTNSASKSAPAPSGDIFSDLITALNRRRVGIAEKQAESAAKTADQENDILAPPVAADEEWAP